MTEKRLKELERDSKLSSNPEWYKSEVGETTREIRRLRNGIKRHKKGFPHNFYETSEHDKKLWRLIE